MLDWGFLGTVPYARAVAIQEKVRQAIREGAGDGALLFLEHPHVYTLGRSAARGDVLLDEEALAAGGVTVEESDRGGQVTYHGPGQLVGYPVIDLNPDRRDIRQYVSELGLVLVRTLAVYGVEAESRTKQPWTGVWVDSRKIASIGVHLSRWVATHGFALNVTTDLAFFRNIVPCGLPDIEMTSLADLTGRRPPLGEVAEVCAGIFAEVFARQLAPLPEGIAEASWVTSS